MATSFMMTAQERLLGGLAKFAGGIAHGAAEGFSLSRPTLGNPMQNPTMWTGRQVGRLAGYTAGAVSGTVGLAAAGAGGAAIKGAPGLAEGVGRVAAQTVAYNAKKAIGASFVTGKTVEAFTHKVDRNLGNLFIGRELRSTPGFLAEAGLVAGGLGLGLHDANKQMAMGTISGFDPNRPGPDALSYDGTVSAPPTRMGDMGGTGDLVTALHANRHGR